MKNKNENAIGGIPRNWFKQLTKIGLTKTAYRINLVRKCTQFSTIRVEIFVTEGKNPVHKFFLLFIDESNDYIAFTSFSALLEYVMLNYTL